MMAFSNSFSTLMAGNARTIHTHSESPDITSDSTAIAHDYSPDIDLPRSLITCCAFLCSFLGLRSNSPKKVDQTT